MIYQKHQAKNRSFNKPSIQNRRSTKTTTIGKFGETLALKYLQNKGYELITQNFHVQGGELDLILKKNDIITFVEVKLRTGKNFGEGGEAITFSKKQKLLRAIFVFLKADHHNRKGQNRNQKEQNRAPPQQTTQRWQLDLISIHFNHFTRTAHIQHIPNILEA